MEYSATNENWTYRENDYRPVECQNVPVTGVISTLSQRNILSEMVLPGVLMIRLWHGTRDVICVTSHFLPLNRPVWFLAGMAVDRLIPGLSPREGESCIVYSWISLYLPRATLDTATVKLG